MSATPPSRAPLRLLALLLPILAIAAMITRSELVVQSGHPWRVRITGFDPRDLLRGHYLRYRLSWRMEGAPTCQGSSCCYCLWDSGGGGAPPVEPAVRVLSCAEKEPCTSAFSASQVEDLEKFYIPEGEGAALEKAIREREASLLLAVSSRGRVVIRDLLLDGVPWRESLKRPPGKAPPP